jgi:flagellar assembly factor FliW
MPTTAPADTVIGMKLTFRRDMPGFKGARHFVVEPLGEGSGGIFARLRCTDTVYLRSGKALSDLAFLVTSPGVLWRGYEVRIDDGLAEEIGLSSSDEAALLAIINPKEPLSESTANLYSPIVINRRTGSADQMIPAVGEGEVGWSVRTPLPTEGTDDPGGR